MHLLGDGAQRMQERGTAAVLRVTTRGADMDEGMAGVLQTSRT